MEKESKQDNQLTKFTQKIYKLNVTVIGRRQARWKCLSSRKHWCTHISRNKWKSRQHAVMAHKMAGGGIKIASSVLISIAVLSLQRPTHLLSLLSDRLATRAAGLDRVTMTAARITARATVMPYCSSPTTAAGETAADKCRWVITGRCLWSTAVHTRHPWQHINYTCHVCRRDVSTVSSTGSRYRLRSTNFANYVLLKKLNLENVLSSTLV